MIFVNFNKTTEAFDVIFQSFRYVKASVREKIFGYFQALLALWYKLQAQSDEFTSSGNYAGGSNVHSEMNRIEKEGDQEEKD